MRLTVRLVLIGVALALAVPATAADVLIMQKDKTFSERTLNIRVGDRITFTNGDPFTHNVFSVTRGMEFDLRTQVPGQSSTVPFTKSGSLLVECAIHPKMKLQVTVAP
jgi:plastocyanin